MIANLQSILVNIVTGSVIAFIAFFINLFLNKRYNNDGNSLVEKVVRIENYVFYQSRSSHVYALRYFEILSIIFIVISSIMFFGFLWHISFYLRFFNFLLWAFLVFVSIKVGVTASRKFEYIVFSITQFIFFIASLAGISEIEKLKNALIGIDQKNNITTPAYFYHHGGLISGYEFLRNWCGSHYLFAYRGVNFNLWYVIQNSSIAMAVITLMFLVNIASLFYFNEDLRTRIAFWNVVLALVIGGLASYPEIYYFLFVK